MRIRRLAVVPLLTFLAVSCGTVPSTTSLARVDIRLAAATGVMITGPTSGATVVATALEISGTAPAHALIAIKIVDTGTARSNVEHQPGGRIDGSATSGDTGAWVFVPQVTVVPGTFSATASYTTRQNQVIASGAVSFVVVDAAGRSGIPTSSGMTSKVVIALALLTLVAIGSLWYRRRRGGPQRVRRPGRRDARPVQTRLEPRRGGQQRQRHDPAGRKQPVQAAPGRPVTDMVSSPSAQPLFMNTAAGRSYRIDQANKLRDINDEIREIEGSLAVTAEALERSYGAVTSLRHEVSREMTEHPLDPTARPTSPRGT